MNSRLIFRIPARGGRTGAKIGRFRTELACRDAFVDSLAGELVPWVHERHTIKADPTWVTIGGYSLGGLGAAFTAFRRPDVCGNPNRLVAEPDHEYEWLTREFIHSSQ